MNTEQEPIQGELQPVAEGEAVVNTHGAIVQRCLLYGGQPAKPGFVWFKWHISKTKHMPQAKGKAFRKPFKAKTIGGIMVKKAFVDVHGEDNIKNMIIVNILNKIK